MTGPEPGGTAAVALVTGAGSLLAEGIVRTLVADGWFVVMTDMNLEHVEPVCRDLPATTAMLMDVRDPLQVQECVDAITSSYGPIHTLVNAAGGAKGIGIEERPFVEMDPRDRATILDANLVGTMNCAYAVLPGMLASRSGSIVSLVAGRAFRGGRNATVYSAAKAGVRAFSQALALEVGGQGVRVNVVIPGNAEVRRAKDPKVRSPLGRHTTGADVGAAVSFLSSSRASHITGAALDVSGGTALH